MGRPFVSSLRRRVATGAGLFWIVVIVGIIFGGLFVVQFLVSDEPVESSVVFYDANGDPVVVSAAIMAGGMEVVSMEVKTKWLVDFDGIDPATFLVRSTVKVYIVTAVGDTLLEVGWKDSVHPNSFDDPNTNWNGYVSVHLWNLEDMLAEHMTDAYKASGWTLKVTASIAPTANDLNGNPVLPDPPTQEAVDAVIGLAWVDTTATMTIVTFEQDQWLPLP